MYFILFERPGKTPQKHTYEDFESIGHSAIEENESSNYIKSNGSL